MAIITFFIGLALGIIIGVLLVGFLIYFQAEKETEAKNDNLKLERINIS